VRNWLWEVVVSAAPGVHSLRLRETEAVGDFSSANEILDVHLFWHLIPIPVAYDCSRE
jgi:hypothetical protein